MAFSCSISLLGRLLCLSSRVLGKPGLPAQGRQRFHCLGAFNSQDLLLRRSVIGSVSQPTAC